MIYQVKQYSHFLPREKSNWEVVQDVEALGRMENHLLSAKTIAWDYETTGLRWYAGDLPCGVAFSARDGDILRSYYVPYRHLSSFGQICPDIALDCQRRILGDPEKTYLAHNAKFDLHMAEADGLEVKGHVLDTMVMGVLYDENRPKGLKYRGVADLGISDADADEKLLSSEVQQLARWLGMTKTKYMEEYGYSGVDIYLCGKYAAKDA